MTAVYGGTRFIRIFAKVSRGGGVKRQWDCRERQRCLAFGRCYFRKLILRQLAKRLECGRSRNCKFSAECVSERILSIGQYLAKIWWPGFCAVIFNSQ